MLQYDTCIHVYSKTQLTNPTLELTGNLGISSSTDVFSDCLSTDVIKLVY